MKHIDITAPPSGAPAGEVRPRRRIVDITAPTPTQFAEQQKAIDAENAARVTESIKKASKK